MRYEEQPIIEIPVSKLLDEAGRMFKDGNRLVQIGCTKTEDGFEINYSFDREYHFQNLRVRIPADGTLPSITPVYFGAFIYENEIHDLFGVSFSGINIDFKGTLIRTSVKYPFSREITKEDDSCQSR